MELSEAVETAARAARPYTAKGRVADYIPQLAGANPEHFGFAVIEIDGTEHTFGDVDIAFPIQSMSKVFSLVLAMQRIGGERAVSREIWERVGREPSGDPFNSLVQLEHEQGIPRNPMINAGALIISDLLLEHCDQPLDSIVELVRGLAGEQILSPSLARRVMAIMLTCGTYDAAGEFAFNVGLPCKSGVAGGIMAAAPDHSGICVWSPPLDKSGNSLAGREALRELTERVDISIF